MIAYSGVVDAGTGELLKKSLKGIAAQKTNPGQVGYSAEVLSTARRNAEHIISGDSARAFRTDDITPRVDKKFGDIGGVNETRYDVAEIRGGRISEAVQVKFVGNNAKECLTLLHSAEFRTKYFSQGIKIEIPADYYDEVLRLDPSLRGSITQSSVTKSEALQAVRSPMMTTARNVAGVSHRAGLEGAGYGAGISGGISAVRNVCAVISGDKDAGEALRDVAKDTACGAAAGYASNFGLSALSSVMKESGANIMRTLADSALPAQIAVGVLEAGKTLLRYASGEIDRRECVAELQEKGAGMAGAVVGAEVGQAVIPVPVVGAVVGSVVGYALAGEVFRRMKMFLDRKELAREERLRVERECREAVKALEEFRTKAESVISQYLAGSIRVFREAFGVMDEAMRLGDVDGYIFGANMLTRKLGGGVQFEDMREFDALMMSDEAFVL